MNLCNKNWRKIHLLRKGEFLLKPPAALKIIAIFEGMFHNEYHFSEALCLQWFECPPVPDDIRQRSHSVKVCRVHLSCSFVVFIRAINT